MNAYKAIVLGEAVDVTLERTGDRIEARIGDRVYVVRVASAEPGVYWFDWDNRSVEVSLLETTEGYSAMIGPYEIPVEVLDARKALKRAAHHGQDGVLEVRAPMPGKIVRLLVEENGNVERNQGIVVMEAMKMQNEIKSLRKGKIRRLSVKEGDAVSLGDLIATVE